MSVEKQLAVWSWKQAAGLCAVLVAVLALPAAGWAQSGPRANRIPQDLSTGGMMRLPGSVHRLTRQATDLGEVNPGMTLNSMTLHFGLSAEQQIEMDALSQAQQDPKSPQYHQWLTQEEYGARFGLTDADLKQVTRWLESQGFTVQDVSKTRNAVRFGGKAWQVESAFHTQLHYYDLKGEKHFANATELQVPAALRGVLLVVRGLNDFRPKPQMRRSSSPNFTVDVGCSTGVCTANFLTPGDWATIYNVNGIYSQSCATASGKCDGTGAYVGVVGQTYAPQADIDHFRSASLLGATKLIYACIDPTTADCTGASAISNQGDLGESDLDIEWAGGIAKNATVVFVYAPWSVVGTSDPVSSQFYDVFDALDHAVNYYKVPATGKVLPVISMSYTDCEQSLTGNAPYLTWITQMGQQANSQGQTILVSSGDVGAAGCDTQNDYPAKQGVSATVPVDSPNYTGVGGTTLSGDEANPSQYWNETVNQQTGLGQVSSARGDIPETVWNDTATNGSLSASSGGVSQFFAQPVWQHGLVSGQTNWRMIPDISFAASADHDGYMSCSQDNNSTVAGTDCATGFESSNGYFDVVGGTSASAPSFAGMLTLLDQKYGPQGNINPTLYAMAANASTYATVFHDTTSGDNIVPCVFGTTGCVGGSAGPPAVSGTMGFSATTGYDLATGLGSIDGGALFTALASNGSPAATTTTLVGQPNPVALNGGITLTATVTSTTAGTITGSVTFGSPARTLGTVAVSSGAAVLSGISATAANGLGEGTDLVTASFTPTGGSFAASAGNAELEVYDPSAPPPLVSLSQSSATTGSGNLVLTVTGANFVSTAKVLWNGSVRATNFVNSTQLKATILSSDLAKEGTALITVATSTRTSAALPFAVVSASPVATITGGLLTVASDGSGNHVLTLTGTDFVAASVVDWNGVPMVTSRVSPWQIAAVVTAAEFGSQPAAVTVVNPAGSSPAFTLP